MNSQNKIMIVNLLLIFILIIYATVMVYETWDMSRREIYTTYWWHLFPQCFGYFLHRKAVKRL